MLLFTIMPDYRGHAMPNRPLLLVWPEHNPELCGLIDNRPRGRSGRVQPVVDSHCTRRHAAGLSVEQYETAYGWR